MSNPALLWSVLVGVLAIRDSIRDGFDTAQQQISDLASVVIEIVVLGVLVKIAINLIRRIVWQRVPREDLLPGTVAVVNNLIAIACIAIGGTILLALWGLTWSVVLTAVSVGTLAVAIGLQDLLKSVIGGIFIIIEQPFSIGDRIEVAGIRGEVIDLNIRTTTLRSDEGLRVVLPNQMVLTTPITNLDRAVVSQSLIVVNGLAGDPEALRAQAEAVLATDPAVASVSTISSDGLRTWWRDALPKILPRQEKSAATAENHVVIKVALFDESAERADELEVARRLRTAFPDSQITVRRGAKLSP